MGPGHAHIGRIHIAPNNRIAAISTDFYTKTWIIDLETGETLVELPNGGKCAFSPDSRYAQVGDRYGESRSLLTIETGELLDFRWAKRWSFSPNSRYAIGGTGRSWFFLELATKRSLSRCSVHAPRYSPPPDTRHLAALEHLYSLNLSHTQVTDEGLGALAALPSLTSVVVYGTAVSEEGQAALVAARPGIRVRRILD